MNHGCRARSAMVGMFVAGVLITGCGAPSPPPTVTASTAASTVANPSSSDPTSSAEGSTSGRGRHGGDGSSSKTGTSLPADWPRDLPVPPGQIIGSTGSNGRWSVLMVMTGSAADVRKSAVAFYTAAGFTAATNSLLNKGNRHLALAAENRDHSATETNLVIAVTLD